LGACTKKSVVAGIAHQATQTEAGGNAVVTTSSNDQLVVRCSDQGIASVRTSDGAAEGGHLKSEGAGG